MIKKRLMIIKLHQLLSKVASDGIAFQSGYALLPGNAIGTGTPTLINNTSMNKLIYIFS